jgi:hypothetical protein
MVAVEKAEVLALETAAMVTIQEMLRQLLQQH